MEFALTDEQQMIAETARAYFSEQATSETTREAMGDGGFDRRLWTSFCVEMGLGGLALPEAYGGAGLGMVELACVAEAAGAQVAAIPLPALAMATAALLAGGSEAQKKKWLPRLADGSAVPACADAFVRNGAGDLLSGRGQFVAYGAHASALLLVGQAKVWIVDTAASGISVEPFVTMDQTRPLATITLADAEVETLDDGAAARAAALRAGWLCLAAEALGGAQAAIDRTVAYSLERKQFGRPIGSFQAYKHRLADRVVDVEQARSAVFWAACAIDEGDAETSLAVHSAKSFAADTYFRCASDMIQLHGGIGFTWEHDAHIFFKRARAIQSALGSSAWHREQIAAILLGNAA
jgi:alkylation response protein AidB-like acyl-CoA dehydrogenase